MGAWSGLWRPVLEPLAAKGIRCVAVDMPPFGFSQRPSDASYGRRAQARRLWGLVDALGARRASLIGHSFGAGSVVEAALSRPERVSSLVLLAPALRLGAPARRPLPFFEKLLSFRLIREVFISATLANPILSRRGLAAFMADPDAATPEHAAILRRPLAVCSTVRELARWLPGFLFDPEDGLSVDETAYSRLGMPTLLIWGDLDQVTPLPEGKALQRLIPNSELVVLPGIGHMPQLESTEKVRELLMGWLSARKA
jgi:2-hydroxymuconate-semialdehyde hydrolase